jgi:hypothetical protein
MNYRAKKNETPFAARFCFDEIMFIRKPLLPFYAGKSRKEKWLTI